MKFLATFLIGAFLAWAPSTFAATEPLTIDVSSSSASTQGNRYYTYNFGQVTINYSEWAEFYLRNNGSAPLYVQGVYLQSGIAYRAWSSCPAYLYSGQQCLIQVEFRPWSNGYETGRLRIQLSTGNIYIDMSGYGSRY